MGEGARRDRLSGSSGYQNHGQHYGKCFHTSSPWRSPSSNSSGSLAKTAAINRTSSFVSNFGADRRPGASSNALVGASLIKL
jgi:hypothetical protein